jgi:hypothetical protein
MVIMPVGCLIGRNAAGTGGQDEYDQQEKQYPEQDQLGLRH